MAPTDDFRPRRKFEDSGLSATVPDIFAPSLQGDRLPNDFTWIELSQSGRLSFPGLWQKEPSNPDESELVSYKLVTSLTARLLVGKLRAGQRAEIIIAGLCRDMPCIFRDYELAALRAALSTVRESPYELSTGSTEILGDRLVLVLQGFYPQTLMKEALLIFPEGDSYAQLSVRCLKEDFPIYFNHLRMALKFIDWS